MLLSDLFDLDGNEKLNVEFKRWMDPTKSPDNAKLAKHFAALANYGGGYLVFGVDDENRKPQSATELPSELFSQDSIAGIVKKYLEPPIQISMIYAEHDDVQYPVVVVPSHGPRPVIGAKDGPQENNSVIGIKKGVIYIRTSGPASSPIEKADDWNALLDRCLSQRSDLLGNILRQSLKSSSPNIQSVDFLKEAMKQTSDDFVTQVNELSSADPALQQRLHDANKHYSVFGYALLDDRGEVIRVDAMRSINDHVNIEMYKYAYDGWSSFIPLDVPKKAPQIRSSVLLDREVTYLEGMRLENMELFTGQLDYWRIYDCGISVIAEAYREDNLNQEHRNIYLRNALVAIHSVLAHARLSGQETGNVSQVMVRMDWRGLLGRRLAYNEQRCVSPIQLSTDVFIKTVTLSWSDLRDTYFSAFRRTALPFLDLFARDGWFDPDEWLVRSNVETELCKGGNKRMRLFEG